MSTYTITFPRKKANTTKAASFVKTDYELYWFLSQRFTFPNLRATSKSMARPVRGKERAELGEEGARRAENGRREKLLF